MSNSKVSKVFVLVFVRVPGLTCSRLHDVVS